MHFDDTEQFQEPKLCCYRKRFIASRALIWSFVSIGATLFSIGYVLKVFTAHYPDDPDTASIFEISGVTLVSVGAGLTALGIVACFHSCCVVLCYRPANKPGKSGSQKSNSNSDKSTKAGKAANGSANLPVNDSITQPPGYPDYVISRQQQQPLLANISNGGFYPVSNASSPPLPHRSATSPKFYPLRDETSNERSNLRETDRRLHQSHGNVNDWSDAERLIQRPDIDISPHAGKDVHPYDDDLLPQKLRKKTTTFAEESNEMPVNRGGSVRSTSNAPATPSSQPPPNRPTKDPRLIAKPLFRIGGPPPDTRGRDTGYVWEQQSQQQHQIQLQQHQQQQQQQRHIGDQRPSHVSQLESASKSPMPRSSNSAMRQRQYFHEEHFTFSDFEPDDAFLPPQQPEQEMDQRQQRARSPLPSSQAGTPRLENQRMRVQHQNSQPLYVNNANLLSSPRPSVIPPAPPQAPVSKYGGQNRSQKSQNFSVDIDSTQHQLGPLSGGSTSSGRGSGSRGGTDIGTDHNPLVYTQNPQQRLPSAVVTVTMASPCLVRRTSPSMSRHMVSMEPSSHEPSPELSAQEQFTHSSGVPDYVRPSERMRFGPNLSNSNATVNATYRSTVIRGQLPAQRQYSVNVEDDECEVDADVDNTSPDPEDAFPTPKKSPKPVRDRALLHGDVGGNLPQPSYTININERSAVAPRRSTPGAFAQDPYVTTQAFLCDNEEII